MKFSYRSDPPLQFQQIVSLFGVGRNATTDPVFWRRTNPPRRSKAWSNRALRRWWVRPLRIRYRGGYSDCLA